MQKRVLVSLAAKALSLWNYAAVHAYGKVERESTSEATALAAFMQAHLEGETL